MNKKYIIPITVMIEIIVLFFFPEPETNFIFYILTIMFFIALIVFLKRRIIN